MILRLSGKRYAHFRRCLHVSRIVENPYRVLGIKAGASKKEVKTAYRDLVKTCHPDLFPDDKSKEAEFRRIQEAYEAIQSGDIAGFKSDSSTGGRSRPSNRPPFGGAHETDWGRNTGFDFEQNYRARMKARAEWEKMAKTYKDAERQKYQKANQHNASWDTGQYANEDGTHWHKDESQHFRSGPRHRSKTYTSGYANDFKSADDYRRFQAARRVQQNLHKSDKFRQTYDEEEIRKMNESAFKRRQQYYNAAAKKEHEDNSWRTESPNAFIARILFHMCSISFMYALYILYRDSKQAHQDEMAKKQLYNNESAIRFHQMVQERLAENSARQNRAQSDEANLSAADRELLERLEQNSAALNSQRGLIGAPGNLK